MLTLPGDLTVPATGPGGATVFFQASARDGDAGALPVRCAPPSGASFPIGTATVLREATDPSGSTARGSFQVTVLGAEPQLGSLVEAVEAAAIPAGIRHALLSKLATARCAIERGNNAAACGSLGAFIHQVQAHAGKKIPAEQAIQLIEAASQIRAVIGSC